MNKCLAEEREKEMERRRQVDVAFDIAEKIQHLLKEDDVIWAWKDYRVFIPSVSKNVKLPKLVQEVLGGEITSTFQRGGGYFIVKLETKVDGKPFTVTFDDVTPNTTEACKIRKVEEVVPEHTETRFEVDEECKKKLDRFLGVKKETK